MAKYFTTAEFVKSDTADKRGINNNIPSSLLANMNELFDNVLNPLRESYRKPIRITSGYRCPVLNKAVGGVSSSDHVNARAADIVGTPNTRAENKKLFDLAQQIGLDFDQLIFEKGTAEGPDWVHISYRSKEGNRHQVLKL